ncbi:MAG: DEAD/DEAH box helicase [Eubacteriales bacterium]|nr:DEAD/DEAH box helicase [Eubacteriales bacterium]
MKDIKYEQSGLNGKILRAVTEMGYETMTPIQASAVPVLLEGRDVIGQAQTGTGKTAAFGIPLLQKIDPDNKNVQAIVLCPTRELAIQAAEEMRKFAKFMHGIKILPIYGGQDIGRQIRALKGGTQVVVGTPGRVMDHMRRHTLKMNDIKTVVLDEADEMLNMGFREDMETILKEVPEDHQTALFSATMPQAILDITNEFQRDAVMVKMPAKELTVPSIKQYYLVCRNEYKEEVIRRLKETHDLKRSLIFCNTKKMVDILAADLKKMGYQAEGLHGDLTQSQRDSVMNRFRSGNLEFLIATDVAARGIDVDDVEAVLNYDVPQDIEYYVHRIGRTGRAGKEGLSFTLINGREIGKIREIERVCKTKIEQYQLPTVKDMGRRKAERALEEVNQILEKQDLSGMKQILEEKIQEEGIDALDIAAAFLKLHVGETSSEVPDELILDHVRESGRQRNQRNDRNARAMRSGNSQNSRKSGNSRTTQNGRSSRSGNSRPREPIAGGSHSRLRILSNAESPYVNQFDQTYASIVPEKTSQTSRKSRPKPHQAKPAKTSPVKASSRNGSRKRQNRAG